MGNRVGKMCTCCSAGLRPEQGDVFSAGDEGFGHSFCYVRPDPARVSLSKVHHSEETTTFRSISGAALGANTSTPLSTDLQKPSVPPISGAAAAFESSDSFQSMPLQPVPRFTGAGGVFSGPLSGILATERGFMSGPLERSFLSGPLDLNVYSGPLERSLSHGGVFAGGRRKKSVMKSLQRAISAAVARTSIVSPIKSGFKENSGVVLENSVSNPSTDLSPDVADSSSGSRNLQWAQGKAGEDRVHVVVSEEHGWLFVGIYDGFNGPDAPDYLLSNLYTAVHSELKGLLWDQPQKAFVAGNECCSISDQVDHLPNSPIQNHDLSSSKPERKIRTKRQKRKNHPNGFHGVTKKWEENQKRWKEFGKENSFAAADHAAVQKALFRALKKTEDRFLEIADRMATENPELALMGSCVLVMLMKGEDVYLMNVGDSRGVLARRKDPEPWDLEKINEEESALPGVRQHCYGYSFSDDVEKYCSLSALQLTVDHSTSVEEEVERIKKEHPDDAFAVMNDRVKGSLKITRAFGAGFLKQPKWNNALLEMFQIDYVGNRPYLTCKPSLYHHRLGPKDQFLILSSDGLYQYFTNEEAVAEVEQFLLSCPEGDPAQHLVEEVLFRAAKKAGMDFHELLEIPHGDRRRYHDDVSIIVVSLEGRIWRSCV